MTFQELFEFDGFDLQANRAGWLSASQKEKWQRYLTRALFNVAVILHHIYLPLVLK